MNQLQIKSFKKNKLIHKYIKLMNEFQLGISLNVIF